MLSYVVSRTTQFAVKILMRHSSITHRLTVFFSSCLLILSLGASPAIALDPGTLPEGGVVISGAASTSTQDAHMQIETSQNVSIDWQTFNIGSQASVTFHQPNSASVALNRVLQAGASEIYGSLTANGQVFLLNPSGVIFGAGAQVDINGGLVASSLSLNDADFASGNYAFHNGTGSGAVENHGSLKGRYVVLLGETIENTGSIVSGNGGVAMVAADSVTLGMPGNELVTVEVTRKALAAAITNEGAITALGGNALLATAQSMDNLLSGVINNTGTIKATRINNTGGTVSLSGGNLENAGDITGQEIDITAGGNVKLEDGSTVTAKGTGSALTISSGKSFTNEAGANALSTPNGRWLIWSGYSSDDKLGGLVYDFKQYDIIRDRGDKPEEDASTGHNGVLYRETPPPLVVSLKGTVSKPFDGNNTATLTPDNYSVTGLIDDDIATITNTAGEYSDSKPNKDGTPKMVTVNRSPDVSISAKNGAVVYGYDVISRSVSGKVGLIYGDLNEPETVPPIEIPSIQDPGAPGQQQPDPVTLASAPAPTPTPDPAPDQGQSRSGTDSANNNNQMPEPNQEMLSRPWQEQQQAARC